jgi:hypothetical protein
MGYSFPKLASSEFDPMKYKSFTDISYYHSGSFTSQNFITILEANGEGFLDGITVSPSTTNQVVELKLTIDGVVQFRGRAEAGYTMGIITEKYLLNDTKLYIRCGNTIGVSFDPFNLVNLPYLDAGNNKIHLTNKVFFKKSLKVEVKKVTAGEGTNLQIDYTGGVKVD